MPSETGSATPRASHPKLEAALARLGASDLSEPCSQPPPPALVHAIEQFNRGEFFEQHETLELLWRATPGEARYLYEGILQVGVGFHHLLEKRNFHGAAVKLDHGVRLLSALPPVCQGVDVARLREEAERGRVRLLELGPGRLAEFQNAWVPRVRLVSREAA